MIGQRVVGAVVLFSVRIADWPGCNQFGFRQRCARLDWTHGALEQQH